MALASCSSPGGPAAPERPARTPRGPLAATAGGEPRGVDLEVRFLRGPIDGFVQIPSGGKPGTTSSRRPTLEELGIENAGALDTRLTLAWGASRLYVAARLLDTSASSILDEDLISNGVSFPAGSAVNGSLGLDRYRVGYGRRFRLSPDRGPEWWPAVEYELLRFSYDLGAQGVPGRAERSFDHGNLRFGLDVRWPLGDRLALHGSAFLPVPLGGTTDLRTTSLEGGVTYALLEDRPWWSELQVGVVFDRLRFRDHQTVPNRIEVDFGPALTIGLSAGR